VARRASAAVQDRLRLGERHPTPPVTANRNRPGAPAHPDRAPDLAA
jgi:hypothetical protein